MNLIVKKLVVNYNGQFSLQIDRFELDYHSIACVMGPSGSGKSTFVHAISGFEKLNAGEILLSNKNINEIPAEKRGIGIVFQGGALFGHLNVEQNISFGLKMRGENKTSVQTKVAKWMHELAITNLAKRNIDQLSGGQIQRVALARVFVMDYPLICLDEPLTGLDPALKLDLLSVVRKYVDKKKCSIIWITHDPMEAKQVSDQMMILNQGVIEQLGSYDGLKSRPSSELVSSFVN